MSGRERKPREDCCGFEADPRIARHFDRDMRQYEAHGEMPPLADTSRGLLELLSDVGELRPTVLEIGSGSGALSVELLQRGAATADGVDLSPRSVATAERRASAPRSGSVRLPDLLRLAGAVS